MTSSSSSGAAVEGWPERWYGQYYQATDVDLGVESPSSPAFHFFYNISLEPAGVRVDYFDSTGEDSGTVMFSTQVDGDELVLVSDEGGDHVDWPPVSGGANETVVVQPGPDCSTLEQETTYTPPGTTYETTLRRGRICLVVPCDPDDGINCTVTVDLCTDDPAPTTCDGM